LRDFFSLNISGNFKVATLPSILLEVMEFFVIPVGVALLAGVLIILTLTTKSKL
jgi:hypothetical protein